ncbi:hypothetical protein AAGT95_16650 [Salinicola lusitanus]|uniref:Uncharacterized protein n=1 Tax=Salinicola lusitanus TaxID=1949085 RepID=A0ABZ3CQQ1_9GAMM
MLNDLIRHARYRDGGRGPLLFDCWGLARHVRHHHFGRALLASWGEIRVDDARGTTRAAMATLPALVESRPVPGALALAWRCGLLVHMGTVVMADGRRCVFDINSQSLTPRMMRLQDFERFYMRVSYHDDRDLPQQAAG